VDDGRSRFVIFGLGDPHLLKGREGSKDRTSDPYGVLSLRRSDNLDLHGGRSKGSQFLGHTLSNTREHSGTTGHDDVSIKILSDINVALHDGLEGAVVDTGSLLTNKVGLEEDLRAAESLTTNDDDVTIRKLVGLLKSRGLVSSLQLLVEVKSNIGKLLLDITDDFTLSSGGEAVTSLSQDLHEVISKISTSKVKTNNSVGKSITLIDRDSVGDTITRVKHASGGTTRGIERQDGLNVNIHSRDVEGLEHDLGHAFSVGLRVKRSLSKKDRVFLRSDTKFVVEGVVPDLLHIIPVGHDTVLNRVLKGKNTSLGLGLISDIGILLVHANHDTRVLRSTDDGREDSSRSVITSKTGLGIIINH
jgi:hypothetical protein